MAETKVTQFNLYVDGNIRPTGEESHRVYDLGSSSQYYNPEVAYQEIYSDFNLDDIHQLEQVQNDFLTVTSARIEVSTTITHDILQPSIPSI